MLITCPNCLSQFSISDDLIPSDGKKLQCSVCLHTWTQSRTAESIIVPEAPVPEQTESLFSWDYIPQPQNQKTLLPEEFRPIKKSRKYIPWVIPLLIIVLIAFIFLGIHLFLPEKAPLPQEADKNFSLSHVQQELFVRSDNSTRIRLQGEILNTSSEGQNLPPLKADIKTLEGNILETQILPSKKVYLQSGDSYLFFEDIISLYPPPLIVDVHF